MSFAAHRSTAEMFLWQRWFIDGQLLSSDADCTALRLLQDTSNFDEFPEEPSTGGTLRAAAANAEVRTGSSLCPSRANRFASI